MIKFNPKKLAKFEVNAWIAHNERNVEGLFSNLTKYYQEFFQLNKINAKKVADLWVQGAKEHDNDDLSKALDPIKQSFELIKSETRREFRISKVAELEINWWKLHDELEFDPEKSRLELAFTRLYSEIFNLDDSLLNLVGFFKALATYEHDLAEDPRTHQTKVGFHWKRCELMLENCYVELLKILSSKD